MGTVRLLYTQTRLPRTTTATMKIVFLTALLGLSAAAKLPGGDETFAAVVREDIVAPQGASFSTDVETDNGIRISQQGQPGNAGQSNIQGSYSYTAPDGTQVDVNYSCDDFGCTYQSPFLPVAPAAPPHVAQLLRNAEEQRAQGITFN